MSPFNAYPWMVFVRVDGVGACGGSLISPTYVLTAANCVAGRQPSAIHLSIGRTDWLEGDGGENRGVSEIKVHPSYEAPADDYSVALLRLSTPSTQEPIKIVSAAERYLWMPGITARLMGWGSVSASSPWVAVLLNEVDVPVQPDSVMSAATAYGRRFHPATMLGAGPLAGGKGGCYGDAGSPLVVSTRAGWRQIGSFSWDDSCAAASKPDVFVRLGAPAILDWIQMVAPDSVLDGVGGPSGDLNGDGKDDLVAFAVEESSRVFSALSTGTAFDAMRLHRSGWFTTRGQTALVGDVDGDHKADLIGFDRGATWGYVQVSTARSSAVSIWDYTFARQPATFAVGDFNGDGRDDIVSFSRGTTADVAVALSTGAKFSTATRWNDSFVADAQIPLVGDFNGDGRDDIASFSSGSPDEVRVALSTGRSFVPSLLPWQQWVATDRVTPAVGDFNGDGRDDLMAFTRGAASHAVVALSTGTGFATPVSWQDWTPLGEEVPGVGDFNGDGKDDVVTYRREGVRDVSVSLSTGIRFLRSTSAWSKAFPNRADDLPMGAQLW